MPFRSPPEFWSRPGLLPSLLEPFALAYDGIGALKRALARPARVGVPVICVGNLVLGGAGKTPVVASLAQRLQARGATPHIISRGYGGTAAGPLAVDPAHHQAQEVGDEPLLLARVAPVWVARDRVAGARAAIAAGASILLLDDGFQNPALAKDLSFIVIDGGYGFGNGHVLPAGPLRETIAAGLARADAVILMGEDEAGIARQIAGTPLLRATLVPTRPEHFVGKKFLAFAGIGRPAKFFATLEATGALLVGRHGFPDHHPYRGDTLNRLSDEARQAGAALVTTAKDWVRLPPAWRDRVQVLEVELAWQDEAALLGQLAKLA